MNIAIIGAGLIGRKRACALPKGVNLLFICDINEKLALDFAEKYGCKVETDWKKIVSNPKIEAVIIATNNKFLSIIAESAILAGKHVLVEKPGAKSVKELERIEKAHDKNKVVVVYGYNHRFHPAIMKAKQIIDSKKYGEVLFMRVKHGHGGRLGYENEWRFEKNLSGGGELLDQGSHLINLVDFFSGKLDYHASYVGTHFWKTKLEDTSFLILKNKNMVANLSATCVEWKNLFCFEIMLKMAKIQIDGLGRSYGRERLTLYKMSKKMGPPKVEEYDFPEEDLSWKKENESFFKKIKNKDFSDKGIKEAKYVLEIIEKSYKNNKS